MHLNRRDFIKFASVGLLGLPFSVCAPDHSRESCEVEVPHYRLNVEDGQKVYKWPQGIFIGYDLFIPDDKKILTDYKLVLSITDSDGIPLYNDVLMSEPPFVIPDRAILAEAKFSDCNNNVSWLNINASFVLHLEPIKDAEQTNCQGISTPQTYILQQGNLDFPKIINECEAFPEVTDNSINT